MKKKKPIPFKLISANQLAEMIGVPVRTLQHWRLVQKGPPYFVVEGRRVRYNLNDVTDWLENQYSDYQEKKRVVV